MTIELLVDNDVLIKLSRFALQERLLHPGCDGACDKSTAVLATARFVVTGRLAKSEKSGRAPAGSLVAFRSLLAQVVEVEPTEQEVELAGMLEEGAMVLGLELDEGESLLVACAVLRCRAARLLTGDKRAVLALEELHAQGKVDRSLRGRVAILEQFMHYLAAVVPPLDLRASVCSSPTTDTALRVCFRCTDPDADSSFFPDGLRSYIEDVRQGAPSLLQAGLTFELNS